MSVLNSAAIIIFLKFQNGCGTPLLIPSNIVFISELYPKPLKWFILHNYVALLPLLSLHIPALASPFFLKYTNYASASGILCLLIPLSGNITFSHSLKSFTLLSPSSCVDWTLCEPVGCGLPASSVYWDSPRQK